MMRTLAFALALWWLLPCGGARAHQASDSYLTLIAAESPGGAASGTAHGTRWSLRWDVALRDLHEVIGLDGNGDGAITWGELRARQPAVEGYVWPRLTLSTRGERCASTRPTMRVDRHRGAAYAVLEAAAQCDPGPLSLEYALLFDVDPTHRGLLRVAHHGRSATAVLAPDQRRFELEAASRWSAFAQYWREGVWHIWIGFDHIAFLLALLLPAVLAFERGRWRPRASFGGALRDVAVVVTAFTLAHSATLTLAALGLVSAPSRWVEPVIAATVLAAALNNLFPVLTRRRALVGFVLGLVHGFGFAGVLAELGLPSGALALALAGFNLGVETGQLAIIAVFLPAAWLLARSPIYRSVVLQAGSAAVALVSAFWLLERSLALDLQSMWRALF